MRQQITAASATDGDRQTLFTSNFLKRKGEIWIETWQIVLARNIISSSTPSLLPPSFRALLLNYSKLLDRFLQPSILGCRLPLLFLLHMKLLNLLLLRLWKWLGRSEEKIMDKIKQINGSRSIRLANSGRLAERHRCTSTQHGDQLFAWLLGLTIGFAQLLLRIKQPVTC